MDAVLAIVLAAWGSLFPERWRARLRIDAALPVPLLTAITGLGEIVLGAALMYFGSPVLRAIVPFLCLEGVIRCAAGVTGVACGIFPLWLIDRLVYGSARGLARVVAITPLTDWVERCVDAEGNPKDGVTAYKIHSSHDYGWTHTTTVEVHGKFWRVVADAHDGPPPRPHAWALGPLTTGWVGRGAPVRYDPRAHLKQETAANAERQNDGRQLVKELIRPPDFGLGAFVALLIAPFVSLLPARTRARFALDGVPVALFTFLTGLIELALMALAYPFSVATFGLISFPTLLVVILLTEAMARTVAGFSGAPCGTLLFWLIERMVMGSAHAWKDARTLPPIADQIAPIEGGFEIRSCRKRAWTDLTTLAIDGAPHHIVRVSERAGEVRPWIYALAPTPPSWVDRSWIDYRPDLILTEATGTPHARDAPPG